MIELSPGLFTRKSSDVPFEKGKSPPAPLSKGGATASSFSKGGETARSLPKGGAKNNYSGFGLGSTLACWAISGTLCSHSIAIRCTP